MFVVVLCTTTINESETIANALVEEGLSACVNIAPEVTSVFRWEGNLEREREALLIIKTQSEKMDQVVERIKGLHSYEVPEIIALPIIGGNEEYLNWVWRSMAP